MNVGIYTSAPYYCPRQKIKLLFRCLGKLYPRYRGREVSIALVDDATVKKLNKKYRRKNSATDVLSFAEQDSRTVPHGTTLLGEIIIAYPFMRSQAAEHGNTVTNELLLLLVHGFLHIIGYGHATRQDQRRMDTQKNKIISHCLKGFNIT